jgi:hypothetical protein
MSSALPAMSDMKADGAPDDIVAVRMRDLADRLAASKAMLGAADIDAPLEPSDVEIQPVSLAAITALRGLESPDNDDDDWLPATPPNLIVLSAWSGPTDAITAIIPALPPPAEPAMSKKSNETASERNLASLLAVLEQPTPLRLAGALPTGVPVPAELSVVSPVDPAADAPTSVVATADTDAPSEPADSGSDSSPLLRFERAYAAGEPLLLADQSGDDIRLVDLVKRQQSLLDQLNSYPPPPRAPEQPIELPAEPAEPPAASVPPPAVRSVVDDLAPTLPLLSSDKRRPSLNVTPPPFSSTGVLRLTGNTPDDDEHLLPERAPMIIERARAERMGLHRASKSAAPSPLPAFAAGVAIALAIAGSLLFVL